MTETPKEMWNELRDAVLSGILPNHNGNLLPATVSQTDRIILQELARETALVNGIDLHGLETRKDFAEWVGDRRPDPTREQWLWLYRNIGARHPNIELHDAIGIMAGRDALLPFLRFSPDLRFVECYERFFEDDMDDDALKPLPYPDVENIVIDDSSLKLRFIRGTFHSITDAQLLARAVTLEKPKVTCYLLERLPSEQRFPRLTKVLRYWSKPEELLCEAVKSFGSELASWRDEYGNGFFWYLYARNQPVSESMIEALSDEIIATWELPNRYGIAPVDIWNWYRVGMI